MDKPIKVQKVGNDSTALKRAFELREEVFIREQKVSREEEFDEYEEISHHFLATNAAGEAVGVARWRRTDHGIKLERFAVRKDYRGSGVGTTLVSAVIEDVEKVAKPGDRLYLHAQLSAVPLYMKFGFQKIGEQFLECDIWHYEMERAATGEAI